MHRRRKERGNGQSQGVQGRSPGEVWAILGAKPPKAAAVIKLITGLILSDGWIFSYSLH